MTSEIEPIDTYINPLEATYNDYLLEKITEMFNREEKDAFITASDAQRPITIRANRLKTTRSSLIQKLTHRGVNLEKIDWSDAGAVVYNSSVPIGATPEYLAGQYILQGASSMLPVLALSPQPEDVVVDMCAAPGGKTSHLAAVMGNKGTIYANDVSASRAVALAANLQRMGVSNTICTVMDALALPYTRVNKVLLDAPCSGTGVLAKDPAAKRNKDAMSVRRLQEKQKELILKAFDMLNPKDPANSVLVYSTCSILVEENECVVDYLLRKRKNAKVVDTELPIGKNGFSSYRGKIFHPSLKLTRRFYPHVHNTDGFYVARIKKMGYSPEEIAAKPAVKAAAKSEGATAVTKKKAALPTASDRARKGLRPKRAQRSPKTNKRPKKE
ncbi:25S rRNA (cytosine2870-C5)-methyltransferase [Nematocida homosporus]|uniref:25S rRNA (cytosine2870-C5)-methyltransferase n=1 Tax=Nematocida homosporus TaxID=1912981 RepID=UPI002220AB9A|nr:25S rRNA (cytosine2870-C5)-methyltransferase [Nematocida homosporus]KAI5185375.1 25S rRNA (cytosine2870-C5)-methyltransferase [Nematocida homosporus]